ncbi:MAG: ASTRA complex subunit [Cirrosporium novae-zelandiae]|nr:MAG: ASTRA complex subunit [Cirrosporium novae-zelandiae]
MPAKLPPPQPVYILRGHAAPIHAVHFFNKNLRLVSGDAEGWIVVWSIITKRPIAVWKGHEKAILGLKSWGQDRVVSHGRDDRIYIWHLPLTPQSQLSTSLPVDSPTQHHKSPWLLHSLKVNALNFCAFSMCLIPSPASQASSSSADRDRDGEALIAVPGLEDSEAIDIMHVPSGERSSTISAPKGLKTGMVMALGIYILCSLSSDSSSKQIIYVAAGYESGHVVLYSCMDALISQSQSPSPTPTTHTDQEKETQLHPPNAQAWTWQTLSTSQLHTETTLSLSLQPSTQPPPPTFFLTTSADANIAKHPIPLPTSPLPQTPPPKVLNTHHSGTPSISLRNDSRIFATAGWDGRGRMYSTKGMREIAVLKWHGKGCYCVAVGDVEVDGDGDGDGKVEIKAGGGGEEGGDVVERTVGSGSLGIVGRERERRVMGTHWVALGSKDGKISLWDVC